MTEYCTATFTWEPDKDPSKVIEYKFGSGESDDREHGRQHSRDHFFILGQVEGDRLQVTHYPSDAVDGHEGSENISHCWMNLECKPVYSMIIKGFAIASEARTLEVYDGRNDSYLQTVRGMRDVEDSEADDSKIHFMCRCTLEEPLKSIKIKFLSLGPRQSFEIAHIRLLVEPSTACGDPSNYQAATGQGINMEKLRRDVDSMGDTVSDRARAFLTTMENFQKGRQGALDDMRHLLVDRNASGSDAPSMMSSMAVGEGAAQGGDRGQMFQFLQSVCSQVAEQRAAVDSLDAKKKEEEEASEKEEQIRQEAGSAELESKLESKLDSLMESRLDAVEERLMSRVDAHLADLETRMSSKLDAVLALLQNASAAPAPKCRSSKSDGQH
ncbi:hypothetical protein BaRGS_00031660 [Batillaria attramentaria]|uniref:Uncharacterized protein n=1 Tax=Batillaria attramentaria TaxID=370345 RepID=A0ABD0JQX0_9CAEN